MKKVWIVVTQYLENYGAHDGSTDKHYWKPKGGGLYRVSLDANSRNYDAIAVVLNKCCETSHHFAEYPISAELEFEMDIDHSDLQYITDVKI